MPSANAGAKRTVSQAAAIYSDAWVNAASGFGGTGTPARLTAFELRQRLSYRTLEGLYTQNWLAAAAVNAMPEDATRRWVQLTSPDDTAHAEYITDEFQRLDVRGVFFRAHVQARLFGGAAIVLGAFDGQDISEPLNLARVRDVQFLNVVNRYRCAPIQYNTDPNDVRYGEITHYLVTELRQTSSRTARVHASRLITWDGVYVTDDERLRNLGWGGSALERAYEPVRDYGIAMTSLTNIIQDFITTGLQVTDLASMVESGHWSEINARMQLASQQRSSHNMVLYGADEKLTREGTPLTGIEEIISKATSEVSAATGIPQSRLFSAMGGVLGGDGGAAADLRNWYDAVATAQGIEYAPRLRKLIDVLGAPKKITGRMIDVEFLPLWEPTATERATEYSAVATADAVYITNGVLSPDEVRATRFGGAKFNTGPVTLIEAEAPEVEERDLETETE